MKPHTTCKLLKSFMERVCNVRKFFLPLTERLEPFHKLHKKKAHSIEWGVAESFPKSQGCAYLTSDQDSLVKGLPLTFLTTYIIVLKFN